MSADAPQSSTQHHTLTCSLNLPQAISLNVANMVGIGPFITIPMFVAAMDGRTRSLPGSSLHFSSSATGSSAASRSGPAGKRRFVPLLERDLSAVASPFGAADGLSLHLAVLDQRHGRDGLWLRRRDALPRIRVSRSGTDAGRVARSRRNERFGGGGLRDCHAPFWRQNINSLAG